MTITTADASTTSIDAALGEADVDGYGDVDFAEVPAADPTVEIDPHWVEFRGDSLLPTLYMPAPMAGRHGTFMRIMAAWLVGIFMLATSLGVCLTYWPNS
jgi:hypothetical protein